MTLAGHDFEITKHASLHSINPTILLTLTAMLTWTLLFQKADQYDPGFSSTSYAPITSFATSLPMHDAGVFEVDFSGERFMPFECAGAISSWRLELNDMFCSFDYDAIDVRGYQESIQLSGAYATRQTS